MLRPLLGLILFLIIVRAVMRLLHGIAEGIAPPRQTPPPAVPLQRDPVCGTYVVPSRALTAGTGPRCGSSAPSGAVRRGAVDEASEQSEATLRAEIVEVGRRLYARGYTASNDGNISVRLDDHRLLMTPKSVCKGFMDAAMMCITDLTGTKLAGDRDPSSEMQMHLEVYRQRPDARPSSTRIRRPRPGSRLPAFRSIARCSPKSSRRSAACRLPIPTPSTKELPEAVRKYVKAHDGMLLANHGALTLGSDLFSAYHKMETIEHFAKISLVARLLGGERLLSRQEVDRLQGLRGMYGIASPAPICPPEDALGDPASCQTVLAPSSEGARLVADRQRRRRRWMATAKFG